MRNGFRINLMLPIYITARRFAAATPTPGFTALCWSVPATLAFITLIRCVAASDELLLLALNQILLPDPAVESLITSLRHQLVKHIADSGELEDGLQQLAAAPWPRRQILITLCSGYGQ